jgi:hypothetical protein
VGDAARSCTKQGFTAFAERQQLFGYFSMR